MARRLRAVTLDYWDTLVDDRVLHGERLALRHAAIGTLLDAYDCRYSPSEIAELYDRAGVAAFKWWADEHRGYTAEERIRFMLRAANREPRDGCEHIARAVRVVDEALLAHPAPLIPGAKELLTALAERVPLAIISDTGFASGVAQDRLLEHHGVRALFTATIYSVDVGHAKPRPEPFRAALEALGLEPGEVLHVGDIEQTDVQGAIAMGMRAIRLDLFRENGPSRAELIARSYAELEQYLNRA
jgi:HAD superfamily hydrolase (TIGR01549 family)